MLLAPLGVYRGPYSTGEPTRERSFDDLPYGLAKVMQLGLDGGKRCTVKMASLTACLEST